MKNIYYAELQEMVNDALKKRPFDGAAAQNLFDAVVKWLVDNKDFVVNVAWRNRSLTKLLKKLFTNIGHALNTATDLLRGVVVLDLMPLLNSTMSKPPIDQDRARDKMLIHWDATLVPKYNSLVKAEEEEKARRHTAPPASSLARPPSPASSEPSSEPLYIPGVPFPPHSEDRSRSRSRSRSPDDDADYWLHGADSGFTQPEAQRVPGSSPGEEAEEVEYAHSSPGRENEPGSTEPSR